MNVFLTSGPAPILMKANSCIHHHDGLITSKHSKTAARTTVCLCKNVKSFAKLYSRNLAVEEAAAFFEKAQLRTRTDFCIAHKGEGLPALFTTSAGSVLNFYPAN